ncbi:Coupling protein CheW [Tritonibacter multivorans]|uniref:Coupling protein CheW n=1 Tax=Tritonibacter multivorans TaxID=928856 RepID=A0A0P1H116_9RHOB|nr:chemotaxis protein CheW [Tritonibacter multivorans]MDA7421097.1 chemotaxis protein CheW [Tritonibacter multivorans]CUH80179.1 Coupling protein CheW [Tritonibacter multivorans]SFC75349.1 CheW protein [Tritonibacter multivorans]
MMTEDAYDLSEHALVSDDGATQRPPETTAGEDDPLSAQAREVETFGSFLIGEMEFALPVGVVQEVVNEPEEVSPVPLSPPHMIGLFNLRGMIVPMIDLRQIFGLPAIEERGGRKITIIEDGEMHLGLVFDRTGEVIHARRSERVAFHSRENGIKDVISEGVLKLDEGRRLLQVLDPYAILKLEKVPRVAKDETAARNRASKGKRQHCISFEVGHSKYAFDLEYVQEVMEVPEIKHSVLTHGHVLGTIDLRGRIVPIVDFRGFVGKQKTDSKKVAASTSNKLLIMNLLEGQIGLLVYSIDSIIPYYAQDVLPISKLAMPHEAIFKGCLAVNNSDLVMLFDHGETMKQPDLVAAAQCCQELYPDGSNAEAEAHSAVSKTRRTFITFSADTNFAMDISEVREVIDCPDDLMTPPNAPEAVAGLFNLREEIITLVDLRLLYGLSPAGAARQKVVIFQCDGQKYGILVDAVNEIIMTTADKVLPYQSTATQGGSAAAAHHDVSEMVQVAGSKDQSKSLMVLDVAALVRHTITR